MLTLRAHACNAHRSPHLTRAVCDGPLGAVRPLERPSWLMADESNCPAVATQLLSAQHNSHEALATAIAITAAHRNYKVLVAPQCGARDDLCNAIMQSPCADGARRKGSMEARAQLLESVMSLTCCRRCGSVPQPTALAAGRSRRLSWRRA